MLKRHLEENIGEHFHNHLLGKAFLATTLKVQTTKGKL